MKHPTPYIDRHLVLTNDIRQVSLLTGFIMELATERELDRSLTLNLNLALEEAVVNVLMYAYPEGTTGLVEIHAVLSGNTLEFTLTDRGKPFDPTAAPETDISVGLDARTGGGLGIHLVRTIMDHIEYTRENGRNILKLTKNI